MRAYLALRRTFFAPYYWRARAQLREAFRLYPTASCALPATSAFLLSVAERWVRVIEPAIHACGRPLGMSA